MSCLQEAMMDHALQMISYIADIDNIVVLMARRKRKGQDGDTDSNSSSSSAKKCLMICHVFSSEDVSQSTGGFYMVCNQHDAFLLSTHILISGFQAELFKKLGCWPNSSFTSPARPHCYIGLSFLITQFCCMVTACLNILSMQ